LGELFARSVMLPDIRIKKYLTKGTQMAALQEGIQVQRQAAGPVNQVRSLNMVIGFLFERGVKSPCWHPPAADWISCKRKPFVGRD
jgi:hypothetical protein